MAKARGLRDIKLLVNEGFIMNKKLKKAILITTISSVLLTGCVGNSNESNKSESKNELDKYVVTRISGGTVMDVWKVETNENPGSERYWEGTNYIFKDSKGNVYQVPVAETNIIKCNDDKTWNSYNEYHWNENILENNDEN